ncbi:MAG: hypothetical protein MUP81_04595 [Dehalococcoidia bacterium]|nr:hypothetical protein [Dehalococcoidia bacterium]
MAGSLSDYAENKVLDHITGKTSFTKPTAYIGLKTADPTDDNSGGTEPTIATGGYARIATTGTDWDAASGGAVANAVALSFPISTAAWSTAATNLTHFIIMDAATAGNLLGHADLTTPRAVNAADIILRFAIGDLDLTLA